VRTVHQHCISNLQPVQFSTYTARIARIHVPPAGHFNYNFNCSTKINPESRTVRSFVLRLMLSYLILSYALL
jgi:hypothetical protein